MSDKPMLQIAIVGEGLRISRMLDIDVFNQAISPVEALHAEYEVMCSEWNEQFHEMKRKQIDAKAEAPEMLENMGTAYEMIMAGQHYAAAVLLKNAIAKAEGRAEA